MDTELFYFLNYTDIEYKLETIVDRISVWMVIQPLHYSLSKYFVKSKMLLTFKIFYEKQNATHFQIFYEKQNATYF